MKLSFMLDELDVPGCSSILSLVSQNLVYFSGGFHNLEYDPKRGFVSCSLWWRSSQLGSLGMYLKIVRIKNLLRMHDFLYLEIFKIFFVQVHSCLSVSYFQTQIKASSST